MLVDMMTGQQVTAVPFANKYRSFLSRMTPIEIAGIESALDTMINGTEIQTAGWMPGKDWSQTPFDPIYQKAAQQNGDLAAQCFGLMVWAVFMKRPEQWTSGRFEKNGEPIGSRTYFQVR